MVEGVRFFFAGGRCSGVFDWGYRFGNSCYCGCLWKPAKLVGLEKSNIFLLVRRRLKGHRLKKMLLNANSPFIAVYEGQICELFILYRSITAIPGFTKEIQSSRFFRRCQGASYQIGLKRVAETSRLEYVGRFYAVLSNDGDSMKYFFLVGILSLLGCQHKLFVDKRMVVREESGYVMIFKEEMAFFASKLKGTDNFLKKDHLKGIRLDKSEFGWLDSLAVDNYVYLSNGAPTDGQVKDTIAILPYILSTIWANIGMVGPKN